MSRPASTLVNAIVEWQENGLPRSAGYEDIYFSGGGLDETEHVFLAGNELPARWRALRDAHFVVGECGFGSGLNFLCCWRLWNALAPAGGSLHYISCEKHPLRHTDLRRIQALWPELAGLAAALQAVYPEHSAGLHRLHLGSAERPVILDLHYGEAADSLRDLLAVSAAGVDAWFLDGFAPGRNPDMWSSRLFAAVAGLSKPGATLSTYTVAAPVRRGLAEAGFQVEKAPGHGAKRHMLKASLKDAAEAVPPSATATPWFSLPPRRRASHAVVIGAGMAGCATAWALARKGIAVSLIEREAAVAPGASGNPRGALYLKLGRRPRPGLNFLLQAWLYALRHYPALQAGTRIDIGWCQSGLLQLAWNAAQREVMESTVADGGYAPQLLRAVSAAEASELAGITLDSPGLWLPQGAALDPAALCEAYRRHPGIELRPCREALSLRREDGLWSIKGEGGTLIRAEAVVIACAHETLRFEQCGHYPLSPVRGQLSYLSATAASAGLRAIVCTRGYLLPARQGRHCLGATFVPGSTDTRVRGEEHRTNLALLGTLSESLREDLAAQPPLGGRASLRCVSPDHLPLAGPVENRGEMLEAYGKLRMNARHRFSRQVLPEAGLYINTAHGSHGLSTTPLAAEYLASLIAGQAPPLTSESIHSLHPARFLIRQLKKHQV